jgi:hypothetical protein
MSLVGVFINLDDADIALLGWLPVQSDDTKAFLLI